MNRIATGRGRVVARRILGVAVAIAAALAVVVGILPCTGATAFPPETRPAGVLAETPAVGPGGPAQPVAIRIPRSGVSSLLVHLHTDAAGVLVPPGSPDVAGWYADGPAPGSRGPAVIAGHVDSRDGPGVFFTLSTLAPGDRIEVERRDGSMVAFRVVGTQTVPKDRFPRDAVYGPTPVSELRLITCGGRFDRSAGRYPSNVVVRAYQTTSSPSS